MKTFVEGGELKFRGSEKHKVVADAEVAEVADVDVDVDADADAWRCFASTTFYCLRRFF